MNRRSRLCLIWAALGLSCAMAYPGEFTLDVKLAHGAPVSLVSFDDQWHYHKGTNAPLAGWQTEDEANLDESWPTGNGAFGFAADNPGETILCQTLLSDMYNRYSTLYIRRSFDVSEPPDPAQKLLLTMDWDDGFVAYLDGGEIRRFNAPDQVGVEPAHNATATTSHESSHGNPQSSPQPATTFDLGPAGSWLLSGRHVLSLIGLNRAVDNTDFILLANLSLAGREVQMDQEGLFTLVKTNSVVLSGINTVSNSTRLSINGVEAWFNLASGYWQSDWALKPGMNRLFITALDPRGSILFSTNRNIVAELGTFWTGGPISTNTTWSASNGVVRVTNDISVAAGATLTITEGTVVLISAGSQIEAGPDSSIKAYGTAEDPIFLLPENPTNDWTDIFATGTGSTLDLRYVQTATGSLSTVAGIPSPPINAAVLADGTNQLQLSWHDTSDNETAFVLERSANAVDWAFLSEVQPNSTSHLDGAASLGQRYYYRVQSKNEAGKSAWSNIAGGIRQPMVTHVGGALTRDMLWSPTMGSIAITSSIVVPTNCRLTMLAGTTVSLTKGASLVAEQGGTIEAAGEAASPVKLMSANPGSLWGELSARGTGAALIARHADISGGQTTVYSNAVGLLEDCYFHDYRNPAGTLFTLPIVLSSFAKEMTLRRCHIREFFETLFRDGVIVIEDSLFEYASGDALDFDGAQPGTVLRRCTFRHGTRAPSNIDAVDIGPGDLGGCRDVVVEDCFIYDFPTDKGISIGDAPNPAFGTIIRNCLIQGCFSGVQVKDSSIAEVYNCTLVENRWGFTNYNKLNPSASTGGGHITDAHNNILWNNGVTISMWNGSTLMADHNVFGNESWPGEGNINVDPLFVNAAGGDYRLRVESPCRGAGRNGADMGVEFPVGAPMAASHPRFEIVQVSDDQLVLWFWADHERSYQLFVSEMPEGPWTPVAEVPAVERPKLVELRQTSPATNRFYRITGVATR